MTSLRSTHTQTAVAYQTVKIATQRSTEALCMLAHWFMMEQLLCGGCWCHPTHPQTGDKPEDEAPGCCSVSSSALPPATEAPFCCPSKLNIKWPICPFSSLLLTLLNHPKLNHYQEQNRLTCLLDRKRGSWQTFKVFPWAVTHSVICCSRCRQWGIIGIGKLIR